MIEKTRIKKGRLRMIKPQILNSIPTVENFLRHCQRQDHKSKSVIVREGELSDSLFIILDGSVSLLVEY
jgi:CRP/FNR family cyclic AMP-dependent transcriptional regulator